ncbi:MAG: TonB family protein [bacterium]|nr:TonB family protein [bacterium]
MANAILVLLVIMLATVSCSRIKQLVQPNTQSDKVNEFNYNIPFGYKNAAPDDGSRGMSRLIILLPDQVHIHLGDLESPPIDLQTLGESIKSFADGKSEYEKPVDIAARYDVDAATLNAVLNELRKHEIDRVNLLISSAERRKDQYGNQGNYEKSMGDIRAPDRFFQVDIRSNAYGEMPGYESKPNPLTLRVRLHPDRSVDLNNESYRDENELSSKLGEVFDAREANAVFRENSNEIEKTVLFQIDWNGTDSNAAHKYGDLIRVIDALKGSGTSPIVLSDSSSYWQAPEKPRIVVRETPPSTGKRVPSTISGGVLNGKATVLPKPPYPPAAKAVRASGAVTVQITVEEDGNAAQAKALSGHPLLRAAAEQAARNARFTPTLPSGQPVKVIGVLIYNFAPQD